MQTYCDGRGLAVLTLSALAAGSACAQDQPFALDIPAQNLTVALNELSRQTHTQVISDGSALEGKRSPALKGQYTARQAVEKLLAGTGLGHTFTAANAVAVKAAPVAKATQPDAVLPTVTVSGQQATPATDPYNADYTLPNATVGTKTDTPVMETPLNIQVISKQVLKDQQVTRLDQALKNVSGVTADQGHYSYGGIDQAITIRGFASNTFLRNGFRLQNGASLREMANVESVEVLKGSAAILYGLVEPGGIVNVTTKQPLATPYYSAQQQFGSYDFYRTTLDATGPLTQNDTLLYRFNASYENSGSFRDFVYNERVHVAPVLKWNIDPKTQATLEFEYTYGNRGPDAQFIPTFNGKLLDIPISRNYGEQGKGKLENIFVGFNWLHQFNDDWSFKHSFAFNQQKTNNLLVVPYTPLYSMTGDKVWRALGQYDPTWETYSTNIDLTGHFDTAGLQHTLLLGGDYYNVDKSEFIANSDIFNDYFYHGNIDEPIHPGLRYDEATSTYIPLPAGTKNGGMVIDPASRRTITQNTDQFGLYFQDQIKLPYNIHVTGGLRYQYIHQKLAQDRYYYSSDGPTPPLTADAVTPRVGVLWRPQDWLSLYGNYTESFGPNEGKVYPSKAVPPSSAEQWEIGAKTEWFNGRLSATLAYYDLSKTNVATRDPKPGREGFSVVAGEVRSRGPELDIRGEILPGWNIIAVYTNNDMTVTKGVLNDKGEYTGYPAAGSRYFGVSRNMANIWNTYDFQDGVLEGLKIGGGVTLRDGQLAYTGTNTDSYKVPGYATVDLLAAYSLKLGGAKLTTQLNINNLLDKRYFSNAYFEGSASKAGYDGGYVNFGIPRTVMGSIKVEF